MITGFTGAGKSQAMACFEDAGYFCVDNLPPEMIGQLAELFEHEGSKVERAAVVSDVRGGDYFDGLVKVLDDLVERATPAPAALPRGVRGRAGEPLQGDAPAASAGQRRLGEPRDRRGAQPARAAARARRREHRHLGPERVAAAQGGGRQDAAARLDRQARGHVPHLRLQARRPARRRPAVRRPLPAQPPLRGRPAAAHRPGPGGARVRGGLGRHRRVLRPPRARCWTTCCPSTSGRARRTSRSASGARAGATARW